MPTPPFLPPKLNSWHVPSPLFPSSPQYNTTTTPADDGRQATETGHSWVGGSCMMGEKKEKEKERMGKKRTVVKRANI